MQRPPTRALPPATAIALSSVRRMMLLPPWPSNGVVGRAMEGARRWLHAISPSSSHPETFDLSQSTRLDAPSRVHPASSVSNIAWYTSPAHRRPCRDWLPLSPQTVQRFFLLSNVGGGRCSVMHMSTAVVGYGVETTTATTKTSSLPEGEGSGDGTMRSSLRVRDDDVENARGPLHHRFDDRDDDEWRDYFGKLSNFVREHGHPHVPREYPPDPQLASWVRHQRRRYGRKKGGRAKKMPKWQVEALESVEFKWNSHDAAWHAQYHRLCLYRDSHGDVNVPRQYPPDPPLASWVARQRTQFHQLRSGRMPPPPLTEERVNLLNEVDFVWDANEAYFERRLSEFVEFRRTYGHGRVPLSYAANPRLGNWVRRQRQEYGYGAMDRDRVEMLLGVGFVFDGREDTWVERVEELRIFMEVHGHCLVPEGYVGVGHDRDADADGDASRMGLGQWVNNVRTAYKNLQRAPSTSSEDGGGGEEEEAEEGHYGDGSSSSSSSSFLTAERVQTLEDMGFVWDANDAAWWGSFQRLVRFREEHGHCMVPNPYVEDRPLTHWVTRQRMEYRRLMRMRVRRPDDAAEPGGGSGRDDCDSDDDRNVSEENSQLEPNSLLTEERLRELILIDFVWDVHDQRWNDMLLDVVGYRRLHGRWPTPSLTDGALGRWLARQRSLLIPGGSDRRRTTIAGAGGGGGAAVPEDSRARSRLEALAEIGFRLDAPHT